MKRFVSLLFIFTSLVSAKLFSDEGIFSPQPIPKQLQNLEFCQSQRLRFDPIEATSYQNDRGDADGIKDKDGDAGKNHGLKLFGYIGESFRPIEKNDVIKDLSIKTSCEYVFFNRTLGFKPSHKRLSPGVRFAVSSNIVENVRFRMAYFQWGKTHSLKLHDHENYSRNESRSIFHEPLEIKTSNDIKNVELQFQFTRPRLFPFIGGEWCLEETSTTLNRESSVSEIKQSFGIQGGIIHKLSIIKYLNIYSKLAITCLNTNADRTLNGMKQESANYFRPKSNFMTGVLCSLPGEGDREFSVFGGFEIQYLWDREIYGHINWADPIALQGINLRISLRY